MFYETREQGFQEEDVEPEDDRDNVVPMRTSNGERKIDESNNGPKRTMTAGEKFADMMLDEWKKHRKDRGISEDDDEMPGSQKEWRAAIGRSAVGKHEENIPAEGNLEERNKAYAAFKEKQRDASALYSAFEEYMNMANMDDEAQTRAVDLLHDILEGHPNLLAGFSSRSQKEQEATLETVERYYNKLSKAA